MSKESRMVLVIAVVADMTIFSSIAILPLAAMVIGAAMILLGIEFLYKPASFVGLLVVTVTAASSIEIPSLLELGMVLTAVIALLVPVLVLIWLSLSAEEGENQQVSVMKRTGAISLGYALVCLWTVPIAILVASLLTPTVSMRITTMTQAAIILVATVAGGIILTRKQPAIVKPPRRGEHTT